MTVVVAAPDVMAGAATAAVQAAGRPGAVVETSTASLADDVRHSWRANFEVLKLRQQQLVLTDIKQQLPKLEMIGVGPINEWQLKQQRAATLAAQKILTVIAMDMQEIVDVGLNEQQAATLAVQKEKMAAREEQRAAAQEQFLLINLFFSFSIRCACPWSFSVASGFPSRLSTCPAASSLCVYRTACCCASCMIRSAALAMPNACCCRASRRKRKSLKQSRWRSRRNFCRSRHDSSLSFVLRS